ncbi:MAG: uracil-DNA glycosylase [Nitrospinae bacterium]|nr:uracil-DNA glycosylase [Nitrospinota bacterium]
MRTLFDDPPTPKAKEKPGINPKIEKSWKKKLAPEFENDYFKNLKKFLDSEREKKKKIYPPGSLIFNAFDKTPFDEVKVVLLGQDPYHGANQAHGLCFSVPEGIKQPPSLVNIFKEIHADLGISPPLHGNLEKWAKQGVLLLNATLTVLAAQAGAHQKKGWEEFTDAVISAINDEKEEVVFLLWGNYAKKKGEIIDVKKHYVLTAAHPSPFSAHSGFFGCKHFSKTNNYLLKVGKDPIDWSLD